MRKRSARSAPAAPAKLSRRVRLMTDVVPRLVPGPLTAGAGKQNAVVVIVVRRYARVVVFAGLGLLSSSIVPMTTDHSSQTATVTVTNFYLLKRGCRVTNLFWAMVELIRFSDFFCNL